MLGSLIIQFARYLSFHKLKYLLLYLQLEITLLFTNFSFEWVNNSAIRIRLYENGRFYSVTLKHFNFPHTWGRADSEQHYTS